MRKPKETKLDNLKADLVRAKEKASEWQARVRDIERQITEQENLEIIQAVRGMISAPEDLRGIVLIFSYILSTRLPVSEDASFLIWLGFLLLLVLGIDFFMSRFITKPISELNASAKRIPTGL